jgi:hypothetical protein
VTNTLAHYIGDEENRFWFSFLFALSNNHGHVLDLILYRNRLECISMPLTSTLALYLRSLLFEGGHVMGSTQVGYNLACKLKTGLEVTGSDKHSSFFIVRN